MPQAIHFGGKAGIILHVCVNRWKSVANTRREKKRNKNLKSIRRLIHYLTIYLSFNQKNKINLAINGSQVTVRKEDLAQLMTIKTNHFRAGQRQQIKFGRIKFKHSQT